LDDRSWWLGVVEFQPSSWSKGSYLNVGVSWLWFEKDYVSFDDGGRIKPFSKFEDQTQFAPLADDLARRAGDEVARYRALYPSVSSAARHLAAKEPMCLWDRFHAGVACGLAGDVANAKQFLTKLGNTDDPLDWAQKLAALAREYCLSLEDSQGFRRQISDVIRRTRVLLRLREPNEIALD
jgi:hypothetical protein